MKLNDDVYLDIVNKCKFTIGTCSLFAYFYNFYHNTPFYYEIVLYFSAIYSFVDLFITSSNESRIHHVITLILCSYYYNIYPIHRSIIVYPLLNTEISSIFYILKYWVKHPQLYTINLGIFYFTFFKFRIYDFYSLIYRCHVNMNMDFSTILIGACDCLFVMNLYWFAIMNKVVYKNLIKFIDIDKDIVCRFICSYTYFIHIPLVFCMYTLNNKYIYDILGVCMLSISSHAYHYDIYTRFRNKEYFLPNKDNIVLFANDTLFIHMRCILGLITKFYNSSKESLYISLTLRFICFYAGIINILYLMKDTNSNSNINHSKFYKYHNLTMFIPYLYDSCLFASRTPIETAIPFLLINTIITMISSIEPFYKLNHVAFHICLIIETYYICLSNNLI